MKILACFAVAFAASSGAGAQPLSVRELVRQFDALVGTLLAIPEEEFPRSSAEEAAQALTMFENAYWKLQELSASTMSEGDKDKLMGDLYYHAEFDNVGKRLDMFRALLSSEQLLAIDRELLKAYRLKRDARGSEALLYASSWKSFIEDEYREKRAIPDSAPDFSGKDQVLPKMPGVVDVDYRRGTIQILFGPEVAAGGMISMSAAPGPGDSLVWKCAMNGAMQGVTLKACR